MSLSTHDHGIREPFEIPIAGDQRRLKATSRRIDERIGHRKTVRERQIGGLEGERFVDGGNRRTAQRRDGRDRVLLAEISTDDFVDLVDFDR